MEEKTKQGIIEFLKKPDAYIIHSWFDGRKYFFCSDGETIMITDILQKKAICNLIATGDLNYERSCFCGKCEGNYFCGFKVTSAR